MAKYNPKIVRSICQHIEQGETNEHAAELAGVTQSTFYQWLNDKSEFSEAVKKAKEEYQKWLHNDILADAERSLKVLINGTEYEEIKTEYEQNPTSPDAPRIKKQTRTTKKILPNPTAVIFALCNRDPGHWQNRISQDVNGRIDVEQKGPGISLANVPDSLLAQVIEAINGK